MNPDQLGQAQPEKYSDLLEAKRIRTQSQFSHFYPGEIDVFTSPESHFRMRAEFRVWHEGDTSFHAMYLPGERNKPVNIGRFTIGSKAIDDLMPKLISRINSSPILRHRLYQAEYLSTLAGDVLVTLIYHKALDPSWEGDAKTLESDLGISIIGRSRKQKIVLSKEFVTESLSLELGQFHYTQYETGFTQPNAIVCSKMLNWAVDKCHSIGGDLLELYCGNGNFTIPLSHCFNQVLATEVSKLSTRSALENIALNNRKNITIIRLSAEEVVQAFDEAREFRRLKDIQLKKYTFSTIFLDPPRAGLDPATEEFASRFDNILYISCNPDTLETNLKQLSLTHDIINFALFDQFPYTEHRECGTLLRKKATAI